jgi:hypothetical protein
LSYRDKVKNIVRVNHIDDFNVQDETTITLEEGKNYVRGAPITTDKRCIVQPNVSLTNNCFTDESVWHYTGTGDMFTVADGEIFDHRIDTISAPDANQVYNCSGVNVSSTVRLQDVRGVAQTQTGRVSKKLGTFDTLGTLLIFNCGFVTSLEGPFSLGLDDGITLLNSFVVLSIDRLGNFGSTTDFIGLDVSGASFQVFELSNIIFSNPNTSAIGIKASRNSANIAPNVVATIRDCEFLGGITPTDGVEYTDVVFRYSVMNSTPLPDTTVRLKSDFEGSTAVTTMSGAGVPTPINALWTPAVTEQLCFSDKLTFDNTTNTCTSVDGIITAAGGTAFNHGLSNGAQIELVENGGLPAELSDGEVYYAGNVTATTFQLYEDEALTTLVTFTDDGTEPNYYCHENGNSSSGWVLFLSETPSTILLGGWVTIEKSAGSDSPVRTVIMETDTNYTVTRRANGSTISARNNVPGSSQIAGLKFFSRREGVIIYVENVSGSVDNEVTDASISYTKV